MKSEDVERVLRGVVPRGAGNELRPRVLGAVAAELRVDRAAKIYRRLAWGAAASVVVGLLLNLWAYRVTERRLARVVGPPPIRKQAAEIAAAVASVTDACTGEWVYERLSVATSVDNSGRYAAMVQQILNQLDDIKKGTAREKAEEGPDPRRDRSGGAGRDTPGAQRLLRVEHRQTA